jgi:hypothetical protein
VRVRCASAPPAQTSKSAAVAGHNLINPFILVVTPS